MCTIVRTIGVAIMRGEGGQVVFRCAICAEPACFGFGCDMVKTPPRLGTWCCAYHRQAGEDAAAAEAAALDPKKSTPPAKPGQGRLL